jgi:SAM-dependent methyltransferase
MSATSPFEYVGCELSIFEKAHNWKTYWRDQIVPYVHGDVLEVGAGIGANTRLLADLSFRLWTAIEPDAALAGQIESPSDRHRKIVGTLEDVGGRFDTILYIDVLEHIEDDRAELARAAAHLAPSGVLIVLSPAHPFLYTPFDAAIGHYRRYTRAALRAAAPAGLKEMRMVNLDAAGMLASAANRFILHSAMPTERQIRTYDGWLVPISRAVDPMFGWRAGKSLLAIWRRED